MALLSGVFSQKDTYAVSRDIIDVEQGERSDCTPYSSERDSEENAPATKPGGWDR